jgi:hypothetical protein
MESEYIKCFESQKFNLEKHEKLINSQGVYIQKLSNEIVI